MGQHLRLTDQYQEALNYAFELHRNQYRKGCGVPYISHLLAVSSLVLEHGGTETQAIAGLLHDAVEDQGGEPTLFAIIAKFGPEVGAIVAGCTDSTEEPKPPWKQRKQAYIAHLKDAPADVLLVSCCDKLHNARSILTDYQDIGEAVWSRFAGGKEGTLWYYNALVTAFKGKVPDRLWTDLHYTVATFTEMAAQA